MIHQNHRSCQGIGKFVFKNHVNKNLDKHIDY